MTILSPADEVHIYNVCTALTDAMEVQPSMQWKIGLKTVLLLEFHIVQTDISQKTHTNTRETNALPPLIPATKRKKE